MSKRKRKGKKKGSRRSRSTSSNKVLQYAGIAFLLYIAGTTLFNTVANRIGFGRPRISLGKVTLNGVAATITIPVTNNNPVSFPLDNLIAAIVYGPYTLATLRLSQPMTIQSGDTTNLLFNTQLDFSQLAGNVAAIIASGEFLQALKVEGTAYSAGVAIPFSNTIQVG